MKQLRRAVVHDDTVSPVFVGKTAIARDPDPEVDEIERVLVEIGDIVMLQFDDVDSIYGHFWWAFRKRQVTFYPENEESSYGV